MVVFPTATNMYIYIHMYLGYTASEWYKCIMSKQNRFIQMTRSYSTNLLALGSWAPGDFLSGSFPARYPPLIKEMDLGSVRRGQISPVNGALISFRLGHVSWRFFGIDVLE